MEVIKDIEKYFEIIVLDNFGGFANGLTVSYQITNINDVLITSGTASETNGIYNFTYSFNEVGSYRLKYETPPTYENGFEQIIVTENEFNILSTGLTAVNHNVLNVIDELELHRQETETRIKYILGLSQQNFRITDQVYNSNNLLTSSSIKIYNNAFDCESNSNVLKEYLMSASYDVDGKITSYKVVES